MKNTNMCLENIFVHKSVSACQAVHSRLARDRSLNLKMARRLDHFVVQTGTDPDKRFQYSIMVDLCISCRQGMYGVDDSENCIYHTSTVLHYMNTVPMFNIITA
jgi:hypothetical protein